MDQDQLNQKLKLAVDDMVKSIQTVRIRPIAKKSYLAMAACFDNTSASTQQIDSCVMNSSNYVKACSNIMQSEIGKFEARLQRCAGQCQDSVQDNHPKMDTQSQVDCAQREMNSCLGQCVERTVRSSVATNHSSLWRYSHNNVTHTEQSNCKSCTSMDSIKNFHSTISELQQYQVLVLRISS